MAPSNQAFLESSATELIPDLTDDARALVRRFTLRVITGVDQDLVYTSTGPRTVIGTHESTDLTLTDRTLSRFHCEIVVTEGAAIVRDMGSKNGTVVDGVPVLAAPLRDGASLTVGRTTIQFGLSEDHAHVELSSKPRFGLLVGRSLPMRAVFAMLERMTKVDSRVLLEGETGTGKDLAAHSIHQESARADGPLIVVDCGAIPPNLLESELFGHEKGAFTNALTTRKGAFEEASGGTLFLDEIGELSIELQPKLLRVLESNEVRRVGGNKMIPVDVRVIAATNRDLAAEVNAGRFRSDLYYRLAVVKVTLPTLRERREDIPVIAAEILERLGVPEEVRKHFKSYDFEANLLRHSWPGNARELRNYLERCVAMETAVPLSPQDTEDEQSLIDINQPLRLARKRWTRHFEKQYLERILDAHDGKVTVAAKAAGIDRVHFHRLRSRCGLI